MVDPKPVPESPGFLAGLLRAGATTRVLGRPAPEPRLQRLRVGRLMHPPPAFLDPETPLVEAERIFGESGADWLPVLEAGRLVGVVTRGDVARWLGGPRE